MNTTNDMYSSGHSKNDQFKFIGQNYLKNPDFNGLV
jgi:hypothetical protein